MPEPDPSALCRRYRHLAAPLIRAGRAYPVATAAAAGPAPRIESCEGDLRLDPELEQLGQAHLAAQRNRYPEVFDGPIAALATTDDGCVRWGRASYFAMLASCDALRAEGSGGPMRRRAERLAKPDPLRRGHGRAATVGVTLLAPHRSAGGPALMLGRRRGDLPLEPGVWHIVPSGTLTPAGLHATLAEELTEEAGVSEPAARALAAGVVSLGTGFDLARLMPDIVLRTTAQLPRAPVPAASEYQDGRELPLNPDGLERIWQELGPEQIAPAAAAALSLFEQAWAHAGAAPGEG